MVRLFGVRLGLLALVSPLAVTSNWVIVAEDAQKQTLMDEDSL